MSMRNNINIQAPRIEVSKAIKIAGNQSKLAKILNIHRVAVTRWKKNGRKYVPDLQAFKLERAFPDEFK